MVQRYLPPMGPGKVDPALGAGLKGNGTAMIMAQILEDAYTDTFRKLASERSGRKNKTSLSAKVDSDGKIIG